MQEYNLKNKTKCFKCFKFTKLKTEEHQRGPTDAVCLMVGCMMSGAIEFISFSADVLSESLSLEDDELPISLYS